MWQAKFDLPDKELDRMIALIAKLTDGLATADAGTREAFAELVTILALGDSAKSQTCPSCKRESRTGATRCAYCWKSLSG